MLKKMNIKLDNDDTLNKIYDIFEHIENKLGIDLESCFYEDKRGEEYLKAIVSNGTFFKDNIIPKENTKYDCRVILQIQSVYYSMKDEDNVKYYFQVLLGKCVYRPFFDNVFIDSELEFSDNEPDESEGEIMKILCVTNKNNSLIIV